ncbi:MAG: fatty acid desaturase CarF family protein [Spirochaetota bacterium]
MKLTLLIATGLAAHVIVHVLIFIRLDFKPGVKLALDFAGFFAGLYIADFCTSLAHWLGDCPDRWHSRYLRGYRELANRHHRTPLAVLQESFWQIRGNIAWLYSPPLFLALYLAHAPAASPAVYMLIALSNGMMISHTLHKSLHSTHQPGPLRALQALGLVISRDYHMRHHVPPYDKNFAALNGWADGLFRRLIVRSKNRDSR